MTRTVFALLWFLLPVGLTSAPQPLPRFTEEREAAALFFVKKQLPELSPLLEDLKKHNRPHYEQEIREIFQITEILADLLDEPKRHDLELKFWKTENKALVIVAKLGTSKSEEKAKLESQLQELAKDLVELDVQSMEMHVDGLEKELTEERESLLRMKENLDKTIRDRYENLLEKVKKRKK
jgi:hypothetical protein